jgi:hypothetical protein
LKVRLLAISGAVAVVVLIVALIAARHSGSRAAAEDPGLLSRVGDPTTSAEAVVRTDGPKGQLTWSLMPLCAEEPGVYITEVRPVGGNGKLRILEWGLRVHQTLSLPDDESHSLAEEGYVVASEVPVTFRCSSTDPPPFVGVRTDRDLKVTATAALFRVLYHDDRGRTGHLDLPFGITLCAEDDQTVACLK